MSKQTPASPDYTGAANAQAASSRDVTEAQTWANRPTINTPFGQQTWETKPTWDPTTGTYINAWTQNTNLTDQSQHALDSEMDITQGKADLAKSKIGQMQDDFGQPMNWDDFTKLADTPQGGQFGAAPDVPNYTSQNIQNSLDTSKLQNVDSSQKYSKNAEDAIYNQWSNRQEPLMQQQKDQLRTQLYNSGLKEGDQAYDAEMKNLENQQSDSRTNAQYQATIGSGQEAQRMQGMDLSTNQNQFNQVQGTGAFANSAAQQALAQQLGIGSQQFNQNLADTQLGDTRQGTQYNQATQSANYQNQQRQQQIAETMQQRGFSLNEINAILGGQQISMPNMPSFNTAGASQAAQYNQSAQSSGQYNLDAFNAQQAGLDSALSGAGSMAMMFSDRRLKKGIIFLRMKDGVNWYIFQYTWDTDDKIRVGVMADEIDPSLVVCHETGYKMVDYGRLG